MCGEIYIRLAEAPKFAWEEYHPNQATHYIQLTEFVFKALHLSSIREFLEKLAEDFGIEKVEVRVCRLPSRSSMVYITENGGKQKLVIRDHRGRVPKKGGVYRHISPSHAFSKKRETQMVTSFLQWDSIARVEKHNPRNASSGTQRRR